MRILHMSELLNSLASVKTSHPRKFSAVELIHKSADVNSVMGEEREVDASAPSGLLSNRHVYSARKPYILIMPLSMRICHNKTGAPSEYFSRRIIKKTWKTKCTQTLFSTTDLSSSEGQIHQSKEETKPEPHGAELVLRNVFIME